MLHRNALIGLALMTWALPSASSQCFGDDGLTPPAPVICCLPTQPILPPFPGFFLPGRGGCILDCAVESQWSASMFMAPPMPIFCDLYVTQMAISSTSTPTVTSLLVMKYARTWTETYTGGMRQVWRFLVNTDLLYNPVGAGPTPCPVPPCSGLSLGFQLPVHFIGNVDYAQDCSNGNWSVMWTLTHHCGAFMHAPSTQRPLPTPFDHANRAYAFAGPAPFTFGPTSQMIGFLSADTTRTTTIDLRANPPIWLCYPEDAVVGSLSGGSVTPCPCSSSSSSGTMWNSFAIGCSIFCQGNVVSTFIPIPSPPLLPQGMGLLQLGTFSGAAGSFPGTREVEAWVGIAASPDPCPAFGFTLPFHIVVGVSHHAGDLGTTFPNQNSVSITTDKHIDLENMLIPNPNVPLGLFVGIGSIFVSSRIWSMSLQ